MCFIVLLIMLKYKVISYLWRVESVIACNLVKIVPVRQVTIMHFTVSSDSVGG